MKTKQFTPQQMLRNNCRTQLYSRSIEQVYELTKLINPELMPTSHYDRIGLLLDTLTPITKEAELPGDYLIRRKKQTQPKEKGKPVIILNNAPTTYIVKFGDSSNTFTGKSTKLLRKKVRKFLREHGYSITTSKEYTNNKGEVIIEAN